MKGRCQSRRDLGLRVASSGEGRAVSRAGWIQTYIASPIGSALASGLATPASVPKKRMAPELPDAIPGGPWWGNQGTHHGGHFDTKSDRMQAERDAQKRLRGHRGVRVHPPYDPGGRRSNVDRTSMCAQT